MRPLRRIDQFLNNITLYRVVLYGLAIIVAAAFISAAIGVLGISFTGLLGSFAVLLTVGFVASRLFPWLFDAVPNFESSLITTLILFLIMPPASTIADAVWLAAAVLIAIGSKYLLAWRHKHLFNPVALAAVALGITGLYPAFWWVATPSLLPVVLVVGLLIVRKARRFRLFLSFVFAAIAVMALVAILGQRPLAEAAVSLFTSWPLVFLGAIMLTEPYTLPPRQRDQLIYGALVGAIFTSQIHIGPFSSTPEMALILGNLYAYLRSPKYRLRLRLIQRVQLAPRIWEFRFTPDRPIKFVPGQYMDFTLPNVPLDSRGNRRTFSLASSPTEPEVRLGTKFYEPSSNFKTALLALGPGATVMAGQLAGNFTLPADGAQKLIFIAGGIGITPFRSMIKFLIDTRTRRDIILFYSVSDAAELSYRDVFEEAAKWGVKIVPILGPGQPPANWKGRSGFLTADIIRQEAPDYGQRYVLISGPNAMVDRYRDLLQGELGVPRNRIATDYFSGY